MSEQRDIDAAFELLGLRPDANASQVHAAYVAALEASSSEEAKKELRAAYAHLRRRHGSGGAAMSTAARAEGASGDSPPRPAESRRRTRSVRSDLPPYEEVLALVDRGQLEAAVIRVCQADWHKALQERGMWEDTLIRLACATRWLAPSSFKMLHDHHGEVFARPAIGHLASAYVAIAETASAWTGWHAFRSPDERLVAFYTRSLCGTLPARRILLEYMGDWIARDRPAFLAQLSSIATLNGALLDLLALMCSQLADDLLVDLPRSGEPELHAERLKTAFPPSPRTLGLGLVAGAAAIKGGRAFFPVLLGSSVVAGATEYFASFLFSTRRRETILDRCLETGVNPHALGLWATKQGMMTRVRPWAQAVSTDRVLAVAFAFEQLCRALDKPLLDA